jgi:hypothetical protein
MSIPKMAKNLPKWEKQWMSHPLWIIIGLLMTLGISPNLIEILLSQISKVAKDPDCINILQNGPTEISSFFCLLTYTFTDDPLYVSEVARGEYDNGSVEENKSKKKQDTTKVGGAPFKVVYSDPFASYIQQLSSKQELIHLENVKKKNQLKDKFYKYIDPDTCTSDMTKMVICKAPWFRQRGLLIRQRNKTKPKFPLIIMPGIILSLQSTNDSDNINNNNNTKYFFVTMCHHHYANLSKCNLDTNVIENDYVINTNSKLQDEDWKHLKQCGVNVFPNPKAYGFELHMDNNGLLFHRLNTNGDMIFDEWDIVQLSKENILQVHHTIISKHFTNKALIYDGYENEFTTLTFDYICDCNCNNKFDIIDKFGDIIHMRDPLYFLFDPEYIKPQGIFALVCNIFIDGIKTQHPSAMVPSVELAQSRIINHDPTEYKNCGITFHARGLRHILTPHARAFFKMSTQGRAVRYWDETTQTYQIGHAWGIAAAFTADRMALSSFSFAVSPSGVNPNPKRVMYCQDKFPYNFWKHPASNMSADLFKTHGFVLGIVKLIHDNESNRRMTKSLKEKLLTGVGISENGFRQCETMPHIALTELTVTEISHISAGGMLKSITKFLLSMVKRYDPCNIRRQILTLIYDNMFDFTRSSHTDYVKLVALETGKTGWKFIQNYHAAFILTMCLPCLISQYDPNFVNLYNGFEKFMIMLGNMFCSTFGNELRIQCERLYEEFMTEWNSNQSNPYILYDKDGTQVFSKQITEIIDDDVKENEDNTSPKKNVPKNDIIITTVNQNDNNDEIIDDNVVVDDDDDDDDDVHNDYNDANNENNDNY